MIRSIGTQTGQVEGLTDPAKPGMSGPSTHKAAKEFESMTIDQMLKPMFDTEDNTDDILGGGEAESMLKPMLVTQFAHLMEDRGGFGLAEAIGRAMDARKNAR